MQSINTDPQQFSQVGYCLFPHVLTAQEAEATRCMLDEAMAAPLPALAGRDGEPQRAGYVGEPHARDLRWLELCRHPRLLDAIETILGPNLILAFSSVFVKLPEAPLKVAWHQDNTYWPSVHGTDVITLWLAIDDADAENNAMKVIPGSQRGWREMDMVEAGENQMLSKSVAVTAAQERSAVTLEMKAGGLSIHDSFIVHGSDANPSARRRAGYTIRYCSTDTAWVDTNEHPVPVFLVRGKAGSRGQGYTNLLPEVEATRRLLGYPPSPERL